MATAYLVRLRHNMDDIPVQLCDTKQEAVKYASTLKWMPSKKLLHATGTPDCGTPNHIDVVKFSNGSPVEVVFRRDYVEGLNSN